MYIEEEIERAQKGTLREDRGWMLDSASPPTVKLPMVGVHRTWHGYRGTHSHYKRGVSTQTDTLCWSLEVQGHTRASLCALSTEHVHVRQWKSMCFWPTRLKITDTVSEHHDRFPQNWCPNDSKEFLKNSWRLSS